MNIQTASGLTLRSSQRALKHHDDAVRREERGRIARELHDSVSQLLVSLQLDLACLKVSSDDACAHQLFSDLDNTLQTLHSEVRALSSSAAAPFLRERLPAALRAMATRFTLLTQIKVTQDVRGHYVSRPKDVEMSLYRIAQEALANVARHAHAKTVKLQLDYRKNGTLTLTIEDDGVGFGISKEAGPREAGVGMKNMRSRVREMGGRLSLKRLPGGSQLSVSIH
jgi:two-component system NarL family sensor kinase